jgi:adenosylcobinamide-phosphate synthase
LEYKIVLALLVDFLFGDPRWLPHPVRLIGWMITRLETPTRRFFSSPGLAGLITALAVIATTAFAAWALIAVAAQVNPLLGDAVAIFLLYTTFATHELAKHGRAVWEALGNGDIVEARRRVSMLVGRDTERLTEAGVVRAAVESIAENSVDGVLAPLFFAAVGGPVLAMAYKAASTLDSMIGYRNERYIEFGKAGARIDDAANWIPARLSAPLIAVAAALAGLRAKAAWKIARRDGQKHLSPNAGISEAAFAGALGIRLGGTMERRGQAVFLPELGDPLAPLEKRHILQANRLMIITTVLAAAVFLLARHGAVSISRMWQ